MVVNASPAVMNEVTVKSLEKSLLFMVELLVKVPAANRQTDVGTEQP